VTLAELTRLLEDFGAGRLTPDQLSEPLTALIVRGGLELALPGGPLEMSPAEHLLTRLAFHFEDPTGDLEQARAEAATVVAALQAFDPGDVLNLWPLLVQSRRMAEIVEKHCAGVISRTSFVSALSAAGFPRPLQQWLLAATPDMLADFAPLLRSNDFKRVKRLAGFAASVA
jgi:hypothetical protein